VSNNVGIDFTELGLHHGSKPGSTAEATEKGQGVVNEKRDDPILSGLAERRGNHSTLR
jgi:hypothetical protein